jgi:hypothetical protein
MKPCSIFLFLSHIQIFSSALCSQNLSEIFLRGEAKFHTHIKQHIIAVWVLIMLLNKVSEFLGTNVDV